MLIDAILKLHEQIQHGKLGSNAQDQVVDHENAALRQLPLIDQTGLLR
jgi:NADH-quinone oxidoreductase subunit B